MAAKSIESVTITKCQICDCTDLESIFFVGYIPPVNKLTIIGVPAAEMKSYPAELLYCRGCSLVQLGCVVDPNILFPKDYPYTSGTTQILHNNFCEMVIDYSKNLSNKSSDKLVVDIGSNDGTLLSKWQQKGYRVVGIEPTDKADLAIENGIPTVKSFFDDKSVARIQQEFGRADIVTATNVFDHIENIHGVMSNIDKILGEKGIFLSESHYLDSVINGLQYDIIYHEHLRYYSIKSLMSLFATHNMEIIHAKKIPTHGGSIRVYAARQGELLINPSVARLVGDENSTDLNSLKKMRSFALKANYAKYDLLALIRGIKQNGGTIYGLGAPSRASTMIAFSGLDNYAIDAICEIKGSFKIGKNMPGTNIPVINEEHIFIKNPSHILIFSWHIAEELIPKIRKLGYKNRFIIPLPNPSVI